MITPSEITYKMIRNYRFRKRVKYHEMAKGMGISPATFSTNLQNLKRNKPVFKFCERIAEYFNQNNITKEEIE